MKGLGDSKVINNIIKIGKIFRYMGNNVFKIN